MEDHHHHHQINHFTRMFSCVRSPLNSLLVKHKGSTTCYFKTFSSYVSFLLNGVIRLGNGGLSLEIQVHNQVIIVGLDNNVHPGITLAHMYTSFVYVCDARKDFDIMLLNHMECMPSLKLIYSF